MNRTKKRRSLASPPKGTVRANMQLPEELHQSMKVIRSARHQREGSDIKLCRVYREAVEMYINAPAQQRLVKQYKATAG